MSDVGDGLKAQNANWSFNDEVALNFDKHANRSIPFYQEGHQVICNLSDFFISPQSICYELGCSTGELTLKLARHNADKKNSDNNSARFIGYDIEADMIELAKGKLIELENAQQPLADVSFIQDDILQLDLSDADMIVAYYTVQFIRPSQRQVLIDKIYSGLNWGGALLLFEKVRANDARFQDICTNLYTDYKLSQGYEADEILAKTRSLKGVLEPFSTQGNIDLLKRAGFVDILSVFKYVSFEGFLAIK